MRIYTSDLSAHLTQTVTVSGFAAAVRDKGGLIFIELRDVSGEIQLVFDDKSDTAVFAAAQSVKKESVITATGLLRERSSKNTKIKNGELEIFVTDIKILSAPQKQFPFELKDNISVNDELRLKYRYLDLRRPSVRDNILFRHRIAAAARAFFYAERFYEIETPMLIKSTPEGARDYLVPSRIHKGHFYALPQSPQIYKQLLMIAGFDRYIQLARCFRDEDLRADRQPEFTQIDIEMSFVDVDDILDMLERFVKSLMKTVLDKEITPIPRIKYDEAIARFGSDKPDTRYGAEITESADGIKRIKFDNAADKISRKELDRIVDYAKGLNDKIAVRGARNADENTVTFTAKFPDGVTGNEREVLSLLGSLRIYVAKKLDIIPRGVYNYLWVTDMPFFEFNPDTGEWDAMHHPFTMPNDNSLPYLETDKSKVYAKAYDLVLNGTELCSGSIRITDPVLQNRMFELLGLGEEEIAAKFGFLTEAYKYGAPPHGGAGIGLDRLAMTLSEAESLRDVTAFPKLKDASEPMSGAPGMTDEGQLAELGLRIVE
ncbi:MAG: aspartate--tRNA ligase [Oscillospiraceae bacterium]|jgi:aspartyl-tRNA synthetase|nr:aspartate--tRNA ligase [Oscillospiraceae bacterium]